MLTLLYILGAWFALSLLAGAWIGAIGYKWNREDERKKLTALSVHIANATPDKRSAA